jgi:hypothetical protein
MLVGNCNYCKHERYIGIWGKPCVTPEPCLYETGKKNWERKLEKYRDDGMLLSKKNIDMRILEIKEKVPQTTTLPDGSYFGTWGGSVIELDYKGKLYELTTEEGVRGIGYKVVVNIKDGVATFTEIKN